MQGGGASSAPQLDASKVSQQQYQTNVNTGVANAYLQNTNQVTPYGNLNYTKTGTQNVGGQEVPQFTATQTLSPAQQGILDRTNTLQTGALDTAQNVLQNVNSSVNTPLNYNGIAQVPTDQTALRDRAYGALTARGTTDINRGESDARARLANQGIAPGTEAYTRSMDQFSRARNDLSQQSEIGAGNIASQDLANGLNIRNQGITERTNLRDAPLNDYSKLLGFGGGTTAPTWAQGTQAQIPATDTTSPALAQYQGQMNAWQQGQQNNNAMMGGLFGLGGSALGAGAFFL